LFSWWKADIRAVNRRVQEVVLTWTHGELDDKHGNKHALS